MVHFTIRDYVLENITFSDLTNFFRPWFLASFSDLPLHSPKQVLLEELSQDCLLGWSYRTKREESCSLSHWATSARQQPPWSMVKPTGGALTDMHIPRETNHSETANHSAFWMHCGDRALQPDIISTSEGCGGWGAETNEKTYIKVFVLMPWECWSMFPSLPCSPPCTCNTRFRRWEWEWALQNLLSTCDLPSWSPLLEANFGWVRVRECSPNEPNTLN